MPVIKENLYRIYDFGPYTEGVQRGLEMKDLRDLKHSTIHDVRPMRDDHNNTCLVRESDWSLKGRCASEEMEGSAVGTRFTNLPAGGCNVCLQGYLAQKNCPLRRTLQ